MINIKLYFKDENLFQFKISGHADYARSGSDIVCAGVSVLALNTINSIETFLEEPMYINEKDEKKGILDCTFPNIKRGLCKPEVMILLKSMSYGLEELQKNYPKNISVKKYALRR
ncbi:MAG: hypothetical protein ATN31_07285 [Candidatus Epulonipiscioides saccharophilum]|nr:MAG: hypothetical protein ATN31_07285 [Epulopiscium sp. AS2M-Bin001]